MGSEQSKKEIQTELKVSLIAGRKRSAIRQAEIVNHNKKLRAELDKLVKDDKIEMAKLKAVEYLDKQKQIQQYEICMHLCDMVQQYNNNGYLYSPDKLKDVENESKLQAFIYCAERLPVKDLKKFLEVIGANWGKDYVKNAVRNKDKMIDELVIKAFLETCVDQNDINSLINSISSYDASLDSWKQRNSMNEGANTNVMMQQGNGYVNMNMNPMGPTINNGNNFTPSVHPHEAFNPQPSDLNHNHNHNHQLPSNSQGNANTLHQANPLDNTYNQNLNQQGGGVIKFDDQLSDSQLNPNIPTQTIQSNKIDHQEKEDDLDDFTARLNKLKNDL